MIKGIPEKRRERGGQIQGTELKALKQQPLYDQLPTLLWQTNRNGQIIFLNRSWKDFTGYLSDSYDSFFQTFIAPQDRNRLKAALHEGLQRQSPFHVEYRLCRTGSSQCWVETFARPYSNAQGNFAGFLGFTFDVSPRKELQRQHRQQQLQQEQLQELTNTGSWSVNLDTEVFCASPKALALLGRANVLQPPTWESFLTHFPEEVAGRLQEEVDKGIKNNRSLHMRVPLQFSSGERRYLLLKAKPLHDEQEGRLLVGVLQDITQQEQKETGQKEEVAQLEKKCQDLNQFAYLVSHDLKAPIRGISSLATWLNEDNREQLDQEGQQRLDMIVDRTKRMYQLIESILQYSRVGRQDQEIEEVDTNAVVHDTLNILNVPDSFEVRIMFPMPNVLYDPMRLSQVFQNLLSNAIKHSDKKAGRIYVSSQEQEANYIFCVADNGQGIAPEDHERIFQMFQTLEGHKNGENSGLGLAFVQKIVENYGGRIWVESQKNEGAKFFFTVPKEPHQQYL